MMDAALVAAGLAAVTAREPQVIVDLAGLKFIDCSGVAVLARGRKLARHAAPPQAGHPVHAAMT